MDITSIVIVGLIVSAFFLFGGVLMYGDIVTRQSRRAQANKVAQPPSLVETSRRSLTTLVANSASGSPTMQKNAG